MAYYVFDDAKNIFEGMTKEEIVNAIASATGVDPSEIDGDVITSAIKEKKAQQNVSLWVGTQNEYNAIATPDENTLYIVTDPHETNELQAQIDQLESQMNQVVTNGLQIETQTASVTPDGSNMLEHSFTVPRNITILEVAYKPNEIMGAAWVHEGIQIDVLGETATLRVYNYTASATATFKLVYSCGGGSIDEVVDIRVGIGGKVYDTAGEAVRSQILKAGFSDYVKEAFLYLLRHVAYKDANGQQYYDELEAAMYMEADVTSITAVFEQGDNVIYDFDSLDDLRQYLTVTANFEDLTSREVLAYTLSGTLEAGTSAITVSYGGKSATFNVNVTVGVPSGYTRYDYIQRFEDTGTVGAAPSAQIRLKEYDNLNVLSCEFAYCALTGHTAGNAIWGRRNGTGSVNSYAFYAGDGDLGFHIHGTDSSPSKPSSANDVVHIVKFVNTSVSPSTVQVDGGTPVSIPWGNNNILNLDPTILTNAFDDSSNSNIPPFVQAGYIKFFNLSCEMVGYYKPVVRDSDNVIGMYDVIEQIFYTCSTASNATIGNANQKYKVGNWS